MLICCLVSPFRAVEAVDTLKGKKNVQLAAVVPFLDLPGRRTGNKQNPHRRISSPISNYTDLNVYAHSDNYPQVRAYNIV